MSIISVFEDMAKDVEDKPQFIKMSQLGVYVFKVIKFQDPYQEKRKVRGEDKESSYYMRPMKVNTVHFNNIDLIDPVIVTPITENKYESMARFVCLMKKNGVIKTYDESKDWYLVYYKRGGKTVWYTFINQEMLDTYMPFIKAGKISEIEKKFCWGGNRHIKEGELVRYYNDK